MAIDVIVRTNSKIIDASTSNEIITSIKVEIGKTGDSICSSDELMIKHGLDTSNSIMKVKAYSDSSVLSAVTDIKNISKEYNK